MNSFIKRTLIPNGVPLMVALLVALSLAIFNPYYAISLDFKWIGILFLSLFLFSRTIFSFVQSGTITIDALDVLLGVFFLYAMLSLAWSPDPAGGTIFLILFLVLWIIFTHVKDTDLTILGSYIAIGITAGAAAVMLIQAFPVKVTGLFWEEYSQFINGGNTHLVWGGFYNHNFMAELLLMTLPFMLAVAWLGRRTFYVWMTVSALIIWVMYFLFATNPGKLEFIVFPSVFFIGLVYWAWGKSRVLAFFVVLLAFSLAAYVTNTYWDKHFEFAGNSLKESILPRVMLYWNTFHMWLDRPLLGFGAGGFNAAYPLFQQSFFDFSPQLGYSALSSKFKTAGAAHNEYLQLLAEFGLVGMGLVVAMVVKLAKSLKKSSINTPVSIAAAVAVCIAIINSFIEFPLQIGSTALIVVISLGILANRARGALSKTSYHITHISKTALALLGVLIMVSLLYVASRFDSGQREHRWVYRLHDSDPVKAYQHHLNVLKYNPFDWSARSWLYDSLHQWNLAIGTPPLSSSDNDLVFQKSLTAGPRDLLIVRRVQYLLETGRLESDRAEIEKWLAHLKKHAYFRVDVWIADAYFHLKTGNRAEAKKSLLKGRYIPFNPAENPLTVIAQEQQMFALKQMIDRPGSGHDRAFPIE